ncbi:MAG: hypothetical protein LAO30_07565 [Acidobacteriia bacterium]|nr:hypothetical protein [Terriglobia bacterium]
MTGNFKAYVGDPDFHDGIIKQVRREVSEVYVEIASYSGAVYTVRFTGVESVISDKPEGMVLYAMGEAEGQPPLREFYFANSNEPHEEGGDSRLKIRARAFSIERM